MFKIYLHDGFVQIFRPLYLGQSQARSQLGCKGRENTPLGPKVSKMVYSFGHVLSNTSWNGI